MAGEAAVGLYNAAYKVIRLGVVVAKSYTTAVFPVLSRLYSQSRETFEQVSRDSIRMMLIIAMPVVIGVSILTERIIDLLYSDEYLGSVPILHVLVWVLVLEFLNPFLSHTLFARGQQRQSMNVAAVSLVVNLSATLWLVTKWGAVGAAAGTVLAGAVACCCYFLYLMRGDELRRTAVNAVRVSIAAVGLAVALFMFRDSQWYFVIFVGTLVYGALLLLARGICPADWRVLRSCWQTGAAR